MLFKTLTAITVLACSAMAAAQADDGMVTAKKPAGMVIAMLNAGYDAELTTDDVGDPLINSQVAGYPLQIFFYDCDEDTHTECGSIQLVAGFDRAKPWTAEAAIKISNDYRFAAVALDDEGDPYLRWDIVTDEGISTRVFVRSLRRFEDTVRVAQDVIFADEQENELPADS